MSNKRHVIPRKRPVDRRESESAPSDPFLTALAAAELDDEPYTDEQKALSDAGRHEILRGETVTLEELKQQFAIDSDTELQASG